MADTPTSAGQVVRVGGRRLRLTNLDKVLYPETGTTKGEVIDYYTRIAAVLIPHVTGRPVTRLRWPEGRRRAVVLREGPRARRTRLGAPDADPALHAARRTTR